MLDPELVVVLGEGVAAWQSGHRASSRRFVHPSFPANGESRSRSRPGRTTAGHGVPQRCRVRDAVDSDGVAGEQGRLVRERLVANSRIPEGTSRSLCQPPVSASADAVTYRKRCARSARKRSTKQRVKYALTIAVFLLPSLIPLLESSGP